MIEVCGWIVARGSNNKCTGYAGFDPSPYRGTLLIRPNPSLIEASGWRGARWSPCRANPVVSFFSPEKEINRESARERERARERKRARERERERERAREREREREKEKEKEKEQESERVRE